MFDIEEGKTIIRIDNQNRKREDERQLRLREKEEDGIGKDEEMNFHIQDDPKKGVVFCREVKYMNLRNVKSSGLKTYTSV